METSNKSKSMKRESYKGKNLTEKQSKISKPLLKSKFKLKSKHAKAKIEKLDKDMKHFIDIHSEMANKAKTSKDINALDSKSLREDLKKDEDLQMKSKKAERDLASQLELITGMSL